MLKMIKDFFNGMAFGVTQIVPGVSGGTIAIILGFYDELIKSVNNFTKDCKKYLKFLFPLIFGVIVGILLFAWFIDYMLVNYSFPTMLFFIGLIVGIIPIVYIRVKSSKIKFKEVMLTIVPIVILIAISHIKGVSIENPAEFINNISIYFMIFIFFVGMIAASALIIPGLSGSFILLLLGVYSLATYAVSSLRLALTDTVLLVNVLKVLVPLGIGIIIGGLITIRLVERLLNNHYKTTYRVILGLLIGSVYLLFNEPIVYQSGMGTNVIIIGIVMFILGCIISFNLGRKKI